MKAIWTYLDIDPFCGFPDEICFIDSLHTSLQLAKIQFDNTELITTTTGKNLIKRYGLSFDHIKTGLDNIPINKYHWAFAKIYSCSIQKEPFIHIDNDFFIFGDLSEIINKSDLVFEQTLRAHRYNVLIELFNNGHDVFKNDFKNTYSFGIIACNSLEVIKEWYLIANDFINTTDWSNSSEQDKLYSNQLFEQYFLSVLSQKRELLISTIEKIEFVHFYGKNKTNPMMMHTAQKLLSKPEYKIDSLILEN